MEANETPTAMALTASAASPVASSSKEQVQLPTRVPQKRLSHEEMLRLLVGRPDQPRFLDLIKIRIRIRVAGENAEFRFSTGLRIFCWVGTVAVTAGPIALTWSTPMRTFDWLAFGAFAILGVVYCVYVDNFVLKISDDHLSYGSFKVSRVSYRDMVSAEMSVSSSGKKFLVIMASGKRIVISGYVESIDEAARLLRYKLGETSGRS